MTCLRTWIVFGFAAVLSLASAGPALSADKAVLFTSDFESGVLNDGAAKQPSQGWQRAGNMPTISQEQARSGKYSAKAYLNKNSSQTPYRTMLQTQWSKTTDPNNRVSPHAPFFEDSWVGFSIYLPSKGAGNWTKASNTYEILIQWHDAHNPFPPPSWDVEESKNPLFSIGITSDLDDSPRHWRVQYLGDSRSPYPTLGSPRPWKYESNRSADMGSIEPDLDKWTDFVVRIRWNYWKVGTSNNKSKLDTTEVFDNVAGSPHSGLIQVWKNGKLVMDGNPIQIGTNDNAGPAFSAGLYKGWRDAPQRNGDTAVTDRVIYFDEFRYGGANAKYEDVAPGGTKAPPASAKKPEAPTGIGATPVR